MHVVNDNLYRVKTHTTTETVTTKDLIEILTFVSDSSSLSIHFSTCFINHKLIILPYCDLLISRFVNIFKIYNVYLKNMGETHSGMVIGINHSHNPDVTIKPWSEVPFMQQRQVSFWWVCIFIPCICRIEKENEVKHLSQLYLHSTIAPHMLHQ